MTKRQTPQTRGPTLERKGKPHTTGPTDGQIEHQKKVRESKTYPPETPDQDPEVHHAVERRSWDILKNKPRQTD